MMTQVETGTAAKPKQNKLLRITAFFVGGGIFGYVAGGWLADNDQLSTVIDALSTAQLAAMFIGLIALIVTPVLILMSFSKKMYAAERTSDEPIDDSEFADAQVQLRWAAVAMLAIGIELFALAWPVSAASEPAILPMVIIVAMLAVQGWSSWVLWKRYDELHRQVTLEGSAISYALIMFVVSIWAALTQLGFGVAFSPVGVVVAISILGTVPVIWLSVSRGLTK